MGISCIQTVKSQKVSKRKQKNNQKFVKLSISCPADVSPGQSQTCDTEGSSCPDEILLNCYIKRWKIKEIEYILGSGPLPGPHPVKDHPWNTSREEYMLNDFSTPRKYARDGVSLPSA